ncbi:MAG: urea carboxylase-associated family protein [bacterium]
MSRRPIEEFVIPRCSGKAFVVPKGRIMRVMQEEGGQVASLVVFNAHDHKEQGMARFSGNLSQILGTGNHYRLGTMFSKVPYERPLLTVTHDTVGRHFLGPHCTSRMMEIWGAPGHRSCTDNFGDALVDFGLTLRDIYSPAAINLFADVRIESSGEGRVDFYPCLSKPGDVVDFLAEMDVLVAVSACPDDVSPMNGYSCKSIGIEILEAV